MKLLVCFDGSDPSKRAIQKAYQLTSDCGIHEVTIIYAHQDNYWISLGDSYAPSSDMLTNFEKLEKEKINEKEEEIKELAKVFADTEAIVEIKTVQGHPKRVITKEAEEGNYDLIIIGSRGLGALRKVVMGSVSNAVIQGTDISVIVVK